MRCFDAKAHARRIRRYGVLYRELGRTGLKVSLLGYGTGGPRLFGQQSEMRLAEQKRLIRRCLDLGVNLFDTAPGYGQSESILGECLRGEIRNSYHIITKWRPDDDALPNERQASLVTSIENSLRVLRTDHIDILLFHGLMDDWYEEAVERYYPVVQRFREEGKVGAIGFSAQFRADPAQSAALTGLTRHPRLWDVVMVKYGILNQRAADRILPLAQELGVGVVNMAAARIRLPDPARLEQTIAEWKEKGYLEMDSLPKRDPLGWLVRGAVDSVVAAGYKFAADHPAISTVLTGTTNIRHLEENARALEHPTLDPTDSGRLVDLFGRVVEYA